MAVEDSLACESAKYNEIIKTRVKQLQDKIEEQRLKLAQMQREAEQQKTEMKQAKKESAETMNLLKSV
jgi:septal ring factor EnvC (AmiA/AmiB activator)